MGGFRPRTNRIIVGFFWLSASSVAACLASDAAVAQVTKYIAVQPIDVCATKGPVTTCAPFNTTSLTGNPTTQNSTTNPIGFVYSYTNPTTHTAVYIDVTRALLNQLGIDVSWNPIVKYVSPIINTATGQTYQTLNVVTSNSACGLPGVPATGLQSCDFLNLSQQPCISKTPNPTCKIASPLAATPSVINMFFVNKLSPPAGQTGSQLYDFSWVDNNGISIGSNTFFPPSPLTPFVSVLAHAIGHNLGWDHTTFGAGPYDPYNSITNPNGGALELTPASTAIGECDAGYSACMANLMTAGNLRTEPTVNCVAVSNPPLPGQTACAPGTPSLANENVDQLTTEAEQWAAGLPVSQQGAAFDPSGLLQPIANSTTMLSASGSSITVNVAGPALNSGRPNETLLAWVLMLPSGLQFNSQFHISSQSRANLVMDADWPHPDQDNTTNGAYNLGTLYAQCAASTAQCLIVEFNQTGAGPNDYVKFSKGFTSRVTNAQLCGADITFIFNDGYMTTGALACPGGVVPSTLMASSQSPDLTAPASPQIVNQTAFATAAASNPPCALDPVTGICPDPTVMGVEDANPATEAQAPVCYSGGVPVQCPP